MPRGVPSSNRGPRLGDGLQQPATQTPTQVLTETGVPIHMEAIERTFWSPVPRPIDLDSTFGLAHSAIILCLVRMQRKMPIVSC